MPCSGFTEVAFLRAQALEGAFRLLSVGSVAEGLSCPSARGIFPPAVPWSLKIGVEKTGLGFSRKRKATGELQSLGEVMNYG